MLLQDKLLNAPGLQPDREEESKHFLSELCPASALQQGK